MNTKIRLCCLCDTIKNLRNNAMNLVILLTKFKKNRFLMPRLHKLNKKL